jgi:hypothetical protein
MVNAAPARWSARRRWRALACCVLLVLVLAATIALLLGR